MTGACRAPSPGWLRAGTSGSHPATRSMPQHTRVVWLRRKDLLRMRASVSPVLCHQNQTPARITSCCNELIKMSTDNTGAG